MIAINELRTGNICEVGGNYWRVESIIGGKNPELYFEENEEYNHYFNANPIPITPELLEACGFGKNGELRVGDISIQCIAGHDGVSIMDGSSDFVNTSYGKYLHQIQNIVFALTGQELTVNIPTNQPA